MVHDLKLLTPLIEPALEIINRTHLKLMAPNLKYGKQRYNMALKQLLKLCGITRPVSITNLELIDRYRLLKAAFGL